MYILMDVFNHSLRFTAGIEFMFLGVNFISFSTNISIIIIHGTGRFYLTATSRDSRFNAL